LGHVTGSGQLVPIVASAIVYDLDVGRPGVRPTAEMGYAACAVASSAPVAEGSIGAGTGCRVGAMFGNTFATKGGIGSASVELGDGLRVAALMVVNAVGDVVDEDGTILAGVRLPPSGAAYANMLEMLKRVPRPAAETSGEATVIGVVATNARLTKEAANKVAQMGHDGLARAVRPAHTMYDGDTIFALATGEIAVDTNLVGAFAAEMTAVAIRRAVRAATTIDTVRSAADWAQAAD
jgi:L-aminopeptidase/D-esterase-like protein